MIAVVWYFACVSAVLLLLVALLARACVKLERRVEKLEARTTKLWEDHPWLTE